MNNSNNNSRSRNRRNQKSNQKLETQIKTLQRQNKVDSVLLRSIPDPPMYKLTNVFSRTVRINLTAAGTITPTTIFTSLGLLAAAASFRLSVNHFTAWANTTDTDVLVITVSETPIAGVARDFSDRGTAGSVRPNLHVQFSRIMRETWFDSASTFTLLSTSNFPTIFDVNVNIELTPSTLTY